VFDARSAHRHVVRHACERGAATAELGVLLPLILVLVLGGIDFGRALYELNVVASAATAGAKYGAHDATHSGNFAGMEDAALDDLRQSVEVADVAVAADRYCVCDDGTEIDCFTGTCSGGPGERRSYVRVRIEKPFNTLFPYPGVPDSVTLSREARMRVQ
jgi:hypothetical protein